jgi:formylglycine-generating enzyme required for sulfatase activity
MNRLMISTICCYLGLISLGCGDHGNKSDSDVASDSSATVDAVGLDVTVDDDVLAQDHSSETDSTPDSRTEDAGEVAIGNLVLIEGGSAAIGCDCSDQAPIEDGYEPALDYCCESQHLSEVYGEIPDFQIDEFEVTNQQFAQFLNQEGNDSCSGLCYVNCESGGLCNENFMENLVTDESGWHVVDGLGLHPVTRVSWQGAKAYCVWAGKRLPSEQEWEYVARRPDGRLFPWGNDYHAGDANLDANYVPEHQYGTLVSTSPVGFYPKDDSSGVYDLAGNVREWVEDDEGIDAAENPKYEGNPWIETPRSDKRIVKGGCSYSPEPFPSTGRWEYNVSENQGYLGTGFRCASDVINH